MILLSLEGSNGRETVLCMTVTSIHIHTSRAMCLSPLPLSPSAVQMWMDPNKKIFTIQFEALFQSTILLCKNANPR